MNESTEGSRMFSSPLVRRAEFLALISEALTDPLHRRLISAYQHGTNPVDAMEIELGKAVMDILTDETQADKDQGL